MLTGAFFFFIAVAILSYGIQGSLQTIFVRKYDAFVVSLYRNVSLIVTMSPVLLFASRDEILEITQHIPLLLAASGIGSVSLILALSSSRYLPIGFSTAIRQIIQISIAVLLGIFLLNEWLTLMQTILLAGIVFVGIALTLLRSDHPHLDPSKIGKGLFLTIAAGAVVAFAFYFFSLLAREVNPFVASYFWEATAGIFVSIHFFIATVTGRRAATGSVSRPDALKIIGIALLTISASSSYAFALSSGPYALATGLLTTTTLVASVMGWIIYKERLTKFQIALIVFAVGLMFLLKVVS